MKNQQPKMFLLRDAENGQDVRMSLPEILKEINRDRSDRWTNYDETDWREGLYWTDYEVIGEIFKIEEVTK